MNRLVHLIAFIVIVTVPLMSQITITVDPGTYLLTGHPSNPDVNMHFDIHNQSNSDMQIVWRRSIETPPPAWSTWICDENKCYFPTVNMPSLPINLAPGEHSDFQIHVNPLLQEGYTPYDITFMDYADTSIVLAFIDGEVLISNSVSTTDNKGSSGLSVYPNPTTDYFFVTETPGLKSIELFNIVGKKIRSYDALPNKQYYVGDLLEGMYLVRLVSSSQKVLKTIRLSKR